MDPKYTYYFFEKDVETCQNVGIDLVNGGLYSRKELDQLWQSVIDHYNQINLSYSIEKKILKGLANRIRWMVDPEFVDNHPVIE